MEGGEGHLHSGRVAVVDPRGGLVGRRLPLAPSPEMEGPVDEGVKRGCAGSEEEHEGLQVLPQFLARLQEDEDDHGDVVGGPADNEGEDDDDGHHEGLDLGLVQDLVAGVL